MSSTVLIVLVVIVVAVVAVLVMAAVSHSKRAGVRRRFGPEFDRLAAERGDPRAAENELAERELDHEALDLRPLDPAERDRFAGAWTNAQAQFIDDPRAAVGQAEQIIGELMTEVGYPAQDRDRQLALASVDHATGLAGYREGRELLDTHAETDDAAAFTETMRQAMQQYRVFFQDLLDHAQQPAAT